MGDTIAVCRLISRDTDPACLGEGPKLMPSRALGSHLGTPTLPPTSLIWRAKKGHPKALFFLILGVMEVLKNLSNDEEAFPLSIRKFIM